MHNQNELGGIRMLTDFKVTHCAFSEFVLLKTSFVDTLAGVADFKTETYPDQQVIIRLSEVKALITELQKRVHYIETGIEDLSTRSLI